MELEASMLRSFARANAKVIPMSQREKNFLTGAKYKEEFMTEFMTNMETRKPIFEREISKGGYKDTARLAASVYRIVEDKIRRELTQKLFGNKGLDEAGVNKIIRDIKIEMRDVFYENYFGK